MQKTQTLTIVALRGISKFDVNEVHLELLCSLDTNEKRRTTAGSNDFVGVVRALENECKASFLFTYS